MVIGGSSVLGDMGQGWRECQSESVRWPGALLLGRWVNSIIRAMVSWRSGKQSVYSDVYYIQGSGVMLFVCLRYIYSITFLVRERKTYLGAAVIPALPILPT